MSRQKKNKVVQKNQIKNEVDMTSAVAETEKLESLEAEIDRARLELEKTRREIEENKEKLKTMPAREVSEDEMIIVKKQVSGFARNAAAKEKIEKEKAYDSVMVTGKFINRRAPGNPAKLTYMKYADDPVKWYTFEDGKIYTIPRGFADQINDYYHRPKFIQKEGPSDPNRQTSMIQEVDTSNKSYAFLPVNF